MRCNLLHALNIAFLIEADLGNGIGMKPVNVNSLIIWISLTPLL